MVKTCPRIHSIMLLKICLHKTFPACFTNYLQNDISNWDYIVNNWRITRTKQNSLSIGLTRHKFEGISPSKHEEEYKTSLKLRNYDKYEKTIILPLGIKQSLKYLTVPETNVTFNSKLTYPSFCLPAFLII